MAERNTMQVPIFSFVIPTHGRPDSLLKLLDSFKANTANLRSMEIILVIDEDDHEMTDFIYDDIRLKRVMVKSGLNMGALNMAGYNTSSGKYIMLLNDDVVIQTTGWDERLLSCFKSFSDGIILVHVNDLIFGEKLCTFPFVSRVFCDIIGGICPTEFRRHRIDDHIYNIFNLLGVLGENRILYLPDVVFEHNHYTLSKGGKRVYEKSDTIDELDKVLFEDLLPKRKQIAAKLIEHIDNFSQQERIENRKRQLDKITDSFSAKKSDHVSIRPNDFIPQSKNSRVTIGVVSADSNSSIALKCIDNIKKYTSNFDLILLDNNFGPDFSHPIEMNRIIDITKTEYLILMDDDVFVEPGWIDGLLRYMNSEVGVVTPLHKDRDGSLSYAGIIFNPDETGDHGHIISYLDSPTPTMTLCSALLLIDMKKCGHIRFNESYNKYFLDIDYGLRIWESGFQIICSPATTITHIGGGTLTQGSRLSNKLFEDQRQIFEREWIKSGKFSKIKENLFKKIPELRSQLELSSDVNALLTPDSFESMSVFRERAARILKKIEPYPTLKKFISNYICRNISWKSLNINNPEYGHLIVLLGLFGHPVMIEQGYQGFNILLCSQNFYAIPETERVFDLQAINDGGNYLFYKAEDLDSIKKQIDTDIAAGFDAGVRHLRQKFAAFFRLKYTYFQLASGFSFWFAKKVFMSFIREAMSPVFRRKVFRLFPLLYRRFKLILRNPGLSVQETRKMIEQKIPKESFYQKAKAFSRYSYNRSRMILHAESQKWIIQANLPKNNFSLVDKQNNI